MTKKTKPMTEASASVCLILATALADLIRLEAIAHCCVIFIMNLSHEIFICLRRYCVIFIARIEYIYICSTYNYANSFRFTYRHNQLLSPMQNYFWQSCLQVKVHAATNTCHKRSVNYKQNRCIFHNSFHPFSGGRTYVYRSSHLLVISPRTSAFEDPL